MEILHFKMEIPLFKMEILLFKNRDSTFQNGNSTFYRMEILHFKMEIPPTFLKVKLTCNFIVKSTVENVEFTDYFFRVKPILLTFRLPEKLSFWKKLIHYINL